LDVDFLNVPEAHVFETFVGGRKPAEGYCLLVIFFPARRLLASIGLYLQNAQFTIPAEGEIYKGGRDSVVGDEGAVEIGEGGKGGGRGRHCCYLLG
jgi:hypothetical protein